MWHNKAESTTSLSDSAHGRVAQAASVQYGLTIPFRKIWDIGEYTMLSLRHKYELTSPTGLEKSSHIAENASI